MSTLEELALQIINCTNCQLHPTRNKAVPGYGSSNPHIMLIGEAPGAEEDELGLPFVGRSGQVLQDMFRYAGLTREMMYIANTVKCRPPNNRDPAPEEKQTCAPYLAKQIELLKPTVIITVGRISMEMFLPGKSITKVHGQLYRVDLPDELNSTNESKMQYIYPVYHPSYALRRVESYAALKEDFAAVPNILYDLIQET